MPGNVRFAVAVHVLVILALSETPVTSATIAGSVNSHPVVIRRLLGLLRRAGLVAGRPGPRGGFRLARRPASITLDTVYRAVEKGGTAPPTHRPNPKCPVGRNVSEVLWTIGQRAEHAFLESLSGQTLSGAVQRVRRRAGAGLR